jgi:hypothetical protein
MGWVYLKVSKLFKRQDVTFSVQADKVRKAGSSLYTNTKQAQTFDLDFSANKSYPPKILLLQKYT